MPPSPAFRCSPRRDLRAETHKRGRSLEGGVLFREKDDDLALFNEMQLKESQNFLVQTADDSEDAFSTRLRYFSDLKLGISIPARGECSNLLNPDGEKTDYDWLLTPPDTPLFPSLDDETPPVNIAQRGRPRSQPNSISRSSTMEKSYKSSRGSASPQRSSQSPRSSSNAFQSSRVPSCARHSSPTPSLRNSSPSRRPSLSPSRSSTSAQRSSTPTSRRPSTGSNSVVASAGARGTSPVNASRGNSTSPKIRAWQSNIPGFSSDAPPNLRTSLADRPASYVRGSSPASSYGKLSPSKVGRQSVSPTPSRRICSSYSHDQDRFSSHSKGSVASYGDDDMESVQSIPVGDGPISKKFGAFPKNKPMAFPKKSSRTLSSCSAPKRSFDSAVRQKDHWKNPQNMFRPLLSSVPSTTFYVGKSTSAQRTMKLRNSSVSTSSNGSSDQGTSIAPDTEGSDQNHDDALSECGNLLPHEVQDEVFAFERADIVNEDTEREPCDGSASMQHNDFNRLGTATISASPEAKFVEADFSKTDSFEYAICSICGCGYRPVDPVEKDAKLCLDCSRKDGLSTLATAVTTLVSQNSTCESMNISEEVKLPNDSDSLVALSRSPEVTDIGKFQHKKCVEEDQNCCFVQRESCLQESSSAEPLALECEQTVDPTDVSQHDTDHSLPHNDTEVLPVGTLKGPQKSLVDASQVAGVSVLLLNRSSSCKERVVQERTSTATAVPYGEPFNARDSTNTLRISVSHGNASTSSSVDVSSSRQTETLAKRQLSGCKSDMENPRHNMNTKFQSTGSSFSGISNIVYQAKGYTSSAHEDNSDNLVRSVECDDEEASVASPEQVPASSDTERGNENQSLKKTSVIPLPDSHESSEVCQATNVLTSELSSNTLNIHLEKNSVALRPNDDDSVSNNGKDFSSYAISDTDVASVMPSCLEEHSELYTSSGGSEFAEVPNNCSLVRVSEIINNCHQNFSGPQIDISMNLESSVENQPSVFPPSDRDFMASVPESKSSDHEHGILAGGSTVLVEGHGGSKGKSLTLEEATDAILFCSSIIQNVANQAASIAIDREGSFPLEGCHPTITMVGKPSSDRKDLRIRPGGRRSLRSPKTRVKRVETNHKRAPSSKTENDEKDGNAGESLSQNIAFPQKIEGTIMPPKLESKCNCTIM